MEAKKYIPGIVKENKDILLFVILLLVSHFLYLAVIRYHVDTRLIDFFPGIGKIKDEVSVLFAKGVYFLVRIFPNFFSAELAAEIITYPPGGFYSYFEVEPGCAAYKIYFQFIFILLFYPGSLWKKGWFIPLGVIVLVFLNYWRLVVLYFIGGMAPEYFPFWHIWLGRILLYPAIFLLWLYSEKRIHAQRSVRIDLCK